MEHTWFFTPQYSGNQYISFGWADGFKYAYINDVSLTAVPEPRTILAGLLLLLPFGISIMRRFVRYAQN